MQRRALLHEHETGLEIADSVCQSQRRDTRPSRHSGHRVCIDGIIFLTEEQRYYEHESMFCRWWMQLGDRLCCNTTKGISAIQVQYTQGRINKTSFHTWRTDVRRSSLVGDSFVNSFRFLFAKADYVSRCLTDQTMLIYHRHIKRPYKSAT